MPANPTPETVPRNAMPYLRVRRALADGRLVCRAQATVPAEWVAAVIAPAPTDPGRKHSTVDLPRGAGRAFVKIYNPRRRYSLWRRLRHSRAIAEAGGYLAYAAAGIAVPELIAWGEVRRFGLWARGFIITRLIDGPTVAQAAADCRDHTLLDRATECLARIHQAGLSHGDARLSNFLAEGDAVLPFDLSGWHHLTEARRRKDLVRFLGSCMVIRDRPSAERLLRRYTADTRWSGDPAALIDEARSYAEARRIA